MCLGRCFRDTCREARRQKFFSNFHKRIQVGFRGRGRKIYRHHPPGRALFAVSPTVVHDIPVTPKREKEGGLPSDFSQSHKKLRCVYPVTGPRENLAAVVAGAPVRAKMKKWVFLFIHFPSLHPSRAGWATVPSPRCAGYAGHMHGHP